MQDGLEQAVPVETIDDLTKEQLAYVAEVSKNARTTWFGLIGLLLFCGVTLLDVQDRDFFEYGASTQLPLINVSVPTANFFWAAPLLVTGLYTYLHLYLDKLWKALRPLSNDIGGKPVTQVVYPWLISDTALERREGVTRGPYWFLTRFVTLCLCWLIGPVAMALFWVKSWAPHDEVLTTLIGLQLAWLCMVGVNSWLGMCRETNAASCAVPVEGSRFLNGSIFVLLAWTVGAYGWAKTEDGRVWALRGEANPETAYLHSADLYRANFVKLDKDWKGREAAWRDYQRAHRDEVIAELSREKTGEADVMAKDISARLKTEFEEDRGEARATLKRRAYRGQDLRNANLIEAMLVGLDLSGARLEGAYLAGARLEGAYLWRAQLAGADLRFARLEGADLTEALLEGTKLGAAKLNEANLQSTNLLGAKLLGSQLKGADFTNANLERALLGSTNLEGAVLVNANLEEAELLVSRLNGALLQRAFMKDAKLGFASVIGTDFSQADDLTQAQLDWTYGDQTTDLSGTGLTPPAHWPEIEIPVGQRVACWKEWVFMQIGVVLKTYIEEIFPKTDVQCTIQGD